jgi:hypothetical protein
LASDSAGTIYAVTGSLFLLAPLLTAVVFAARPRELVLARPGLLLRVALITLAAGMALLCFYWVAVAGSEPWDVGETCANALGQSPTSEFRGRVQLEQSFFPPSVQCRLGAARAELISPGTAIGWVAAEVTGLALTAVGPVLAVIGVVRERSRSS